VLLCFFAGVVGGAVGQAWSHTPMPGIGAGAGICGLIGLTVALSVVSRRSPRAIRPGAGTWMTALFLMYWLLSDRYTSDFPPIVPLGLLIATGLGAIVGLAVLGGVALPVTQESRKEWRPFAYVAAFALLVGFVGGVTHHRHADLKVEDELITQGYLSLPRTLASAELQNELAYPRLINEKSTPETIDIAERLAAAAVENSDRQNALILDTLAVARYKQGNADDAKALITEALKLFDDMLKDPKAQPDLKAVMKVQSLVKRHLEDITSGSPLRPDPDLSESGML
jgi:hypothetical protein